MEEPGVLCSPSSVPGFCSRAGRFPPASRVLGKRRGAEGRGRKEETSVSAARAPGAGAVTSKAVPLEQPVAAGRSGCRGGRVRTVAETGREMRWLTQGKVNDFRTGRGGAFSRLQSVST